MRQIGVLAKSEEAQRFADYLVGLGMEAHAEPDGESWAVWVRDEESVPQAREELGKFRLDPSDSRYRAARAQAETKRRAEAEKRQQAARNTVSMRGRWNRGFLQRAPLTAALIGLCAVIFVASDFGAQPLKNEVMRALQFVDPVHLTEIPAGEWDTPSARLTDIRNGQVWRFLSPIFLHLDIMHLAFNMFWLYQLGDQIESRRGTWRMAGLVLLIALPSVALQSLVPIAWGGSPLGGGMSGVVYGLLGFVWMRSYFDPQSGMAVRRDIVIIMLIWMVLGFSGVLETFDLHIANWAHGIGLLAGAICGALPALWQSPSKA